LKTRKIESTEAPKATGGYSQAVEIVNFDRVLFISGQIPQGVDGLVPKDFRSQCLLVWRNLESQLRAAGMSLENLVKVTTFLSDRRYSEENSQVRREVLAGKRPALTEIITGIYDEKWLVGIEAIAAA